MREALKARRKRGIVALIRGTYPVGFNVYTAKIGMEIEKLISWELICQLISCNTWEEWIAMIHEEVRPSIIEAMHLEECL